MIVYDEIMDVCSKVPSAGSLCHIKRYVQKHTQKALRLDLFDLQPTYSVLSVVLTWK